MADDLDDFFDEIEEVEAEVVKEDGVAPPESSSPSSASPAAKSEEPPAAATEENDGSPPTKRAKVEPAPVQAPVRPKGLVVAAASSAVIRKPKEDTIIDSSNDAWTGATSSGFASSSHLPPPPPAGPVIPPPPPLPPLPPGAPPTQAQQSASKKPVKRMAAGKVWLDPTLDEWPENDFRIFCGNLDKGVTDEQLYAHYKQYASLAKAKIVLDASGTSRGYGFVSFLQPLDCAKAIRETDQTWLGSRPIRVKRSDWKDRNLNQVLKKNKKQSKQRKRMGL
jgi:hypothetical protein